MFSENCVQRRDCLHLFCSSDWFFSAYSVRISSAALVWCFPSTGFLSLCAQRCNPEGARAVVDDLYPGRTPLGTAAMDCPRQGTQRSRENPAVTLLSLPVCLGNNCWEIHPTPWFAGEGFNSSWPCLCSDLHVRRAGSAQNNKVYQHCSCSH